MENNQNDYGWLLSVGEERFKEILKDSIRDVLAEKRAEPVYTAKEAAKMLNISYPTLWQWKDKGKIHPAEIPGTRKLLFTESEIKRVLSGSL